MEAVEVEGLVVRYGELVAVDGISFTARSGRITAVLGANGAGKTSTIEVCEGYRPKAAGRVQVLGLDPAREQARLSERMGVMLQDGGVTPAARVGETIRHYCALYGRGVDAGEVIDRVGLSARASSTWRRLSGGEKQRVSLALALAARPDVAFLDEPTSGVDVAGRDTVRTIVRDLAAGGCAVVLATHELDEAERIADHVLLFDRGRIVADGTLDELLSGSARIRFRSSPGLDVRAIEGATGRTARALGGGTYIVESPPDPEVMSALAGWLRDGGHPLEDLDAGRNRLEDLYRRLTATPAEP